jgi:hypothetical protein
VETVQINDLVFVVAPEVVEAPKSKSSSSVFRPKGKAGVCNPVPQSKLILAVAKRHGWENVRVVGHGEMIDQPIETNGWQVTPIEEYKGIIPAEALQKVETLADTGIRVKGFLVADDLRHDAQKSVNISSAKVIKGIDWGIVVNVLSKLAAVTLIGTAVITLFPIVLVAGAVVAGIAYDPVLVVVTAENEWICLSEWWE